MEAPSTTNGAKINVLIIATPIIAHNIDFPHSIHTLFSF